MTEDCLVLTALTVHADMLILHCIASGSNCCKAGCNDFASSKVGNATSCALQGANNITLEGVFHGISKQGAFADASRLVWYGSDDVMDAWLPALL